MLRVQAVVWVTVPVSIPTGADWTDLRLQVLPMSFCFRDIKSNQSYKCGFVAELCIMYHTAIHQRERVLGHIWTFSASDIIPRDPDSIQLVASGTVLRRPLSISLRICDRSTPIFGHKHLSNQTLQNEPQVFALLELSIIEPCTP